MLALAGAHAVGGVALHQLDVVVALLRRVVKILELQVFVEVDKVLALRMGHDGPGVAGAACRFGHLRHSLWARKAAMGCGQQAGTLAVQRLGRAVIHAVDAAAGKDPRWQRGRYKLLHGIGPAHGRAGLVQQIRGRGVAHAHDHAIAGHVFAGARIGLAIGQQARQGHAGDPASAVARMGFVNSPAIEHPDSGGAYRFTGSTGRRLAAHIGHGGDFHARAQGVEHRCESFAVGHQRHCGLHGAHRVAVDQALRRTAGHDAGDVVVPEYRRQLKSPAGYHHGLSAQFGHALRVDQRHPVVGVVTDGCGVGQHADQRFCSHRSLQFAQGLQRCRAAAQLVARAAAAACVFIHHHDLRPGPCSVQSRLQTRDTRADDQHVAKIVALGRVQGGLGQIEFSQTGEVADHAFPQWEQRFGVKRLVIKAHWQKTRQQPHEAVAVVLDATGGVDRDQVHALAQRLHIATDVHGLGRLQHHVDVVVGQCQHAARAVVLEGAAQRVLPGGPQGGADAVTGIAAAIAPLKTKAQGRTAVQPLTGLRGQAHGITAGHRERSFQSHRFGYRAPQ